MSPRQLPVGLIAALLLAASLVGTGRAATLVEDGKARAVIILPEKASPAAQGAARVLRDHIRQMSGAELPVRTEDRVRGEPGREQAWVLVGEGKLAGKLGLSSKGLGAGGIVLSAKGHVLALFGTDARTPADPHGTRYAVTTFLEDKLGVRYLWPGELGKVVPRRDTIAVADFQLRFTPKLAQRRIRDMGYHDRIQAGLDRLGFTKEDFERLRADARRTEAEPADWFGWHRLGGSLTLNGGHAFGHLWGKYGKEHPEWFARQHDGSRDQSAGPERARLCKSNPDLIQGLNYYVVARLHWDPDQDVSAVVDDYCRAGFGPAAKPVRRYFDRLESLMDEAAAGKGKAVAAFTPSALAGLRKELDQARKEAGGDVAIAKRVALLELGLRWTEAEAHAHAFLADAEKADRKAAGKALDGRLALMKEIFRKSPLAVNVAYVSWGEDALWARLGWKP